jgi:uncharacterized protein YbaP (TraB family)
MNTLTNLDHLSPWTAKAIWQVTETNSVERRNLFKIDPGREAHLATIVASSRSRISEFETIVKQIQMIPEILVALEGMSALLKDIAFMEDTRIKLARAQIDHLLSSALDD